MLHLSGVIVFLAVLRAQAQATPTPSQTYPNHKIMDKHGNYMLYWLYDDSTITFEIIAKTTGYIGLGWSPKGGMAYGDIIISGVHANGTGYFKDCHGQDRNAMPNCDETQNVMPVMSEEKSGYTRVKFWRQLETCQEGDLPVKSGTLRVIWSMGRTDVIEWHGSTNRGTRSLQLLGIKQVESELPPDVKTFDILKDNYLVPDIETHYECEIRKLPTLVDKHHVIKVIPVITQPELVHHLVVYVCAAKINTWANMSSQVNNGSGCYWNMGRTMWSYSYCNAPIFGWAVGGGNFTLPNYTGIPIGTDKEPFYVKLEIHYNNINRAKNVHDSSGLRIFYTRTLREQDAGLLSLGKMSMDELMIPPRQPKFTVYSYIPRNCTGEFGFGNKTQVKAFAYFLHSHYAGVAIRFRHFRDGKELAYIGDDPSYDFDYQNFVTMPREILLERGDEFLLECTYDTTDRTNATLGGLSSLEEMCLVYLYVYPRIPLSVVYTYTNHDAQVAFYTLNRKDNRMPTSTTWRSFLASNIIWDKTIFKDPVNDWQQIEKAQEDYGAMCLAFHGSGVVSKWPSGMSPFKIVSEYKPPPSPCMPPISGSANVALQRNLILMNLANVALLFATIM